MLIGFVFWCRRLALGGVAGVGRLKLLQPFFGLSLVGLLLDEPVPWTITAGTPITLLFVPALYYAVFKLRPEQDSA